MQAYIGSLKTTNKANVEMRSRSSSSSSATSDQEGLNRAQDGAIVYLPPVPPSKNKKQSPQAAIDEFWGKFNSKTPGRGKLPEEPACKLFLIFSLASTILPKRQIREKGRRENSKGSRSRRECCCIVRAGSQTLQGEGRQDCQRMPSSQPEIPRSTFRYRIRLEMGRQELPHHAGRYSRRGDYVCAGIGEESRGHIPRNQNSSSVVRPPMTFDRAEMGIAGLCLLCVHWGTKQV